MIFAKQLKNLYYVIQKEQIHKQVLEWQSVLNQRRSFEFSTATSRTQRKRACIVLLLLNHFHIRYYSFAIT